MHGDVIAQRVENPQSSIRLPEIALELIAGVATVDPVLAFLQATARARLEVVNR
jgi:hypothetical protein